MFLLLQLKPGGNASFFPHPGKNKASLNCFLDKKRLLHENIYTHDIMQGLK